MGTTNLMTAIYESPWNRIVCTLRPLITQINETHKTSSKLLQIHPIVPETQTLWGAKVIRSNHVTLLGHGLAEWFREWGQGCGVMDKNILASQT